MFSESQNFFQFRFIIEAIDHAFFNRLLVAYFQLTVDICVRKMNQTLIIFYFSDISQQFLERPCKRYSEFCRLVSFFFFFLINFLRFCRLPLPLNVLFKIYIASVFFNLFYWLALIDIIWDRFLLLSSSALFNLSGLSAVLLLIISFFH